MGLGEQPRVFGFQPLNTPAAHGGGLDSLNAKGIQAEPKYGILWPR